MKADYAHILKQHWGYDRFRGLQAEAIESVGDGRDTLVLMPTGGGKSIIYQVSAMAAEGVCVVVTPLISLMKDQLDALRARRILAEAIHAGIPQRDADRILDNCIYGDVKFLFIAPERIDSEIFRMRFARMSVSLIAVDEAHCISQWGYDFRPAYLRIARLRELQPDAPVLALTASATPAVCEDIMRQLHFRAPNLLRMSFARPNLCYLVRRTEDKREQLLRILGNVSGSGIVYVRTREKTQIIAELLRDNGIKAGSYHGGMGYQTRAVKQEEWTQGRTRVMVATNAFGMGIDKADVRVVVHYDLGDSLESYYQEAGRAGRDGRTAYAVLLLTPEDEGKTERRLALDFPPVETIRAIYDGLYNYLQIGIGGGKGQVFGLNLYELASRLKVFVPTLLNALSILQQNGYLVFADEVDNPPRLRFIVQRDDLYRIRVERRELDHLITVLLRQYSGLFSGFRPIDIEELAYISGYTIEHVNALLKKLWQLHLIKYIPASKCPMLILSEERLPTADVRISPESYTLRKEAAASRLEAMQGYADNDAECRSIVIQRYFGETEAAPCGICDVCRDRRKREEEGSGELDRKIIAALVDAPAEIRTLASRLDGEISLILARVEALIESGKIADDERGILRIIR